MEYLRTDTVSVGTLYRKDAKLSRGAGAYFCKHFVPAGAQGGRSPAGLAAAVFAGGLAFFVASLPCLSGRRRGAWRFWSPADLAAAVFAGELAFFAASLPCLSGRRRGAWRFWSPACPAFSLLSFPHPPAPLPGGKGENQGYFMQGASPLASPGAEPMVRRPNGRKCFPLGSAGSQGEGGPGEMELSVASDGGV